MVERHTAQPPWRLSLSAHAVIYASLAGLLIVSFFFFLRTSRTEVTYVDDNVQVRSHPTPDASLDSVPAVRD